MQTISLQASPGDIHFGISMKLTFVMIILVRGLPGDQGKVQVADIVNDALLHNFITVGAYALGRLHGIDPKQAQVDLIMS